MPTHNCRIWPQLRLAAAWAVRVRLSAPIGSAPSCINTPLRFGLHPAQTVQNWFFLCRRSARQPRRLAPSQCGGWFSNGSIYIRHARALRSGSCGRRLRGSSDLCEKLHASCGTAVPGVQQPFGHQFALSGQPRRAPTQRMALPAGSDGAPAPGSMGYAFQAALDRAKSQWQ